MQIGPYQFDSTNFLAPMAGLASTPFRGIAREHGAGATPTELISANGLLHHNRRTAAMIQPAPGEAPFWVQLFGPDPGRMARAAASAVELGAHMIDVNMGCPVRKVTTDGGGAALMQDPQRAVRMVQEIRQAVGDQIPVTVKMRAGWDRQHLNAVELSVRLQDVGVAAVCLHPRTRGQRYGGRADWSIIAALKSALSVPVIGNGDVRCAAHGARMREETGCDAVAVGRGALGNPWIFQSLVQGFDVDPDPATRTKVVLDHFNRLVADSGDAKRAVLRSRSRLLHYSRGLDGGVEFRRSIVHVADPETFAAELERYFSTAQRARGFKPGDDPS